MPFDDVRRLLAAAGAQIATARPPGSQGRPEEATTRPAKLVEHPVLQTGPVGSAEACPEPLAFLDGVQRHQVVGYVGAAPVIAADVAAGVRERHGKRLVTAVKARERLLLGRPEALAVIPVPPGRRAVAIDAGETLHPIRDLDAAVAAVDRERMRLEVKVSEQWRVKAPDTWLIVDGSLAESPAWARDARMLGVSKSHATLPFDGADLVTYLHLPPGHRCSIYQPASRTHAPVYAWALRLWDWNGRDLLYGLVRVEAAPEQLTLREADRWSRWILAERAPVASRDARWDRLLYGIHSVEETLRAGLERA